MRLLIVGSGAREHALAWNLGKSHRVSEICVAPGNAGTDAIARNLDLSIIDIEGLARKAQQEHIDLTVVGPEVPLAEGIVDVFRSRDMPIFGPTQSAACVESSKVFAKELMIKKGIPCPSSAVFSSHEKAKEYLELQPMPVVVKADGLAAGKGVVVARSTKEAAKAIDDLMKARIFGSSGERVIIEEFLTGREVSLLVFVDGKTIVPLVPACDYKRVYDDDYGPNTGGMGSYSPPQFFDDALTQEVTHTILEPMVEALAEQGVPYVGVLYVGLMVTPEGPKVLEFNARFGDPETQAILPRLKTDLLEALLATVEGRLDHCQIEWSDESCVGVVMASAGYPGSYSRGYPITGLDKLDPDILVFHAGTRVQDGRTLTDGGRVLTVTALGRTMAEAREKVYSNISRIHFRGSQYRTDIALAEVK